MKLTKSSDKYTATELAAFIANPAQADATIAKLKLRLKDGAFASKHATYKTRLAQLEGLDKIKAQLQDLAQE